MWQAAEVRTASEEGLCMPAVWLACVAITDMVSTVVVLHTL